MRTDPKSGTVNQRPVTLLAQALILASGGVVPDLCQLSAN
jgi:hypothetical protein